MRHVFVFLIFYFIFIPIASAAVVINEISPSTDPEWIELYNDGATEVDLSNYRLEDANASKSDDLTLSGIIAPGGLMIFSRSEGWLNNGGDTVKLYNNATPSAALIDEYTYSSLDNTESIARSPNGSENWLKSTPTQGTANPTPTPAPTPTPVPSPSQVVSSSTTPTPAPTPTPVPSPSPKATPTPTQDTKQSVGTVAGATADIDLSAFAAAKSPASIKPSPSPSATLRLNPDRARFAIIVGSGLLCVSLAMYIGYRKYYISHKKITRDIIDSNE